MTALRVAVAAGLFGLIGQDGEAVKFHRDFFVAGKADIHVHDSNTSNKLAAGPKVPGARGQMILIFFPSGPGS